MELRLSVKQQTFLRNIILAPHLLVQEIPGQVQYTANTDTERKHVEGIRKWFCGCFKEKLEFEKNGELKSAPVFDEEKTFKINKGGADFLLKMVESYTRAGSGVNFSGPYEDLVSQLKGKPCPIPDFSIEDKDEIK